MDILFTKSRGTLRATSNLHEIPLFHYFFYFRNNFKCTFTSLGLNFGGYLQPTGSLHRCVVRSLGILYMEMIPV